MRGKRLPDETVVAAMELKQQGLPYRKIAKKLGISIAAIAENTQGIEPLRRPYRQRQGLTVNSEPREPEVTSAPAKEYKWNLGGLMLVRAEPAPPRQNLSDRLKRMRKWQEMDEWRDWMDKRIKLLKEEIRHIEAGIPKNQERRWTIGDDITPVLDPKGEYPDLNSCLSDCWEIKGPPPKYKSAGGG